MSDSMLDVRIASIADESPRVRSFALEAAGPEPLPPFTPGAHIDCHLPDGVVRSYSLLNAPEDASRYVIGVAKDADGRGGSRHIHEIWKVGDRIKISPPRNNFALVEEADYSVFIAGGIGITPLLSMVTRLDQLGRRWEMHYAVRTRSEAAFLDRIEQAGVTTPRLHVRFHDEEGATRLNIAEVVQAAPTRAHLYCCGPLRMLDAFADAAKDRPADHLHVEYFTPREAAATDGGYEVVCQRSGPTIAVAPGQRMLDALLDAGINISFSCSEGMCGTCETRVVEGVPDHRDQFLSPEEQESNTLVMVCCSGSKTPKLVLDL